jgi:hypothetical protein
MSWFPAGLPPLGARLAVAIDGRFAPIEPDKPRRDFKRETASDLPPAEGWEGCTIYVRDVDGAGAACPVFSDGAAWRRYDTRGAV